MRPSLSNVASAPLSLHSFDRVHPLPARVRPAVLGSRAASTRRDRNRRDRVTTWLRDIFIDGDWRIARSQRRFPVINPATEERSPTSSTPKPPTSMRLYSPPIARLPPGGQRRSRRGRAMCGRWLTCWWSAARRLRASSRPRTARRSPRRERGRAWRRAFAVRGVRGGARLRAGHQDQSDERRAHARQTGTSRRRGSHHALEFSADPHPHQARAGADGRLHRGHQAGRRKRRWPRGRSRMRRRRPDFRLASSIW